MTSEDTCRQQWNGGLPPELWLCVLDHLCPHCHPSPALPPGAEFTEIHDVTDWVLGPLPYTSRDALLAMSRTCRYLRVLALKYVCHRFDSPGKGNKILACFRRTMEDRPDLASGVREMSVTSEPYDRSILKLVNSIRTLNFIVRPDNWDGRWAQSLLKVPVVDFGESRLVGELERLHTLRLMPPHRCRVDVARGRLWLENLMKAGPQLRSLICHDFIDGYLIRDSQGNRDPRLVYSLLRGTFPNYLGLPENKITRLDLRRTWFRYYSLEQLLNNFSHLREFKLSCVAPSSPSFQLTTDDKMVRPVDGYDVVTLLEPLKQQLEVLELDFRQYPKSQTRLGAFRPIRSLTAFTALKTLKLGHLSIMPPQFNSAAADKMTDEKARRLHEIFIERTKDFLVRLLPCRSLEYLEIDGIDDVLDHPVVELARRANLQEFPNLKHVRLRPSILYDRRFRLLGRSYVGLGHDLHRLVPEGYWRRAYCISSGGLIMESDVRPLFQKAGVLFERTVLRWCVRAKEDSEPVDGLIEAYPRNLSITEGTCTLSFTARNSKAWIILS